MTNANLKLRGEMKLQKCAVDGCNEVPSERLERFPEPVWCKPHYDLLKHKISQRDYQDFVDKLRERGIEGDPILIGALVPAEERRCCIPGCSREISTVINFEPYKVPGLTPVCDAHSFAANYASQRMNPHRIVYEMEQTRKGKAPDPYREKRRNAILALCEKYSGTKYIEHICAELQRQRIRLLAHWVQEWNRNYALGLQEWDWLVAYRANKATKKKIQHYISNICNPKVRASR